MTCPGEIWGDVWEIQHFPSLQKEATKCLVSFMFQPIPALRNRFTCVHQAATAIMITLQVQFWLYDLCYAENVGFLNIASLNGPARVILVAMTMRKTILQTYICIHLVGLQDYHLASVLIHIHTLRMRATKALASLCACADSPERSLLADAISTKIACAGSNFLYVFDRILMKYLWSRLFIIMRT